jgi:hypothetical protein
MTSGFALMAISRAAAALRLLLLLLVMLPLWLLLRRSRCGFLGAIVARFG